MGNLTAPLCDITDDLLENLQETMENNDGQIKDVTEKVTGWAFQSKLSDPNISLKNKIVLFP